MSLFSTKEFEDNTQIDFKTTSDGPRCFDCGLYKKCQSPKMKYTGQGRMKTLIVAEASGEQEDQTGKQLVGKVGQFFRGKLRKLGCNLDTDFWKMNAVNCRPTKKALNKAGKTVLANREPTPHEIQCCRPMIDEAINELKPVNIILMGGAACKSFYMDDFSNTGISRFRGLKIPDRDHNAWIFPVFHPSYPQRQNDANLDACYDRDLANVIKRLEKTPPNYTTDDDSCITLLTDFDEIIDRLSVINDQDFFFDYETTGISPFVRGQKVLTASYSIDPNEAFSFPVAWRDFFSAKQLEVLKSRLFRVFDNNTCMAQNMKYEHLWTKIVLGHEITTWGWDTQIGSHILDNRHKYTGLKFQTYVQFGRRPYDKAIKKFIKGTPFNNMEKAPLEDVLHYGGLDSFYGRKLVDRQIADFDWDEDNGGKLYDAYDLLHDGTLACAKVEENGINVNEEYYQEQINIIKTETDKLIKYFSESDDSKKFYNFTGRALKVKKDVSSDDVRTMLFKVLKCKSEKKTESGLPSVDESVLKAIDNDFCQNTLKLRKLNKVRSYPGQFLRNTIDGKMRPSIALTIPVTYRSSVNNPSFQNIPKRDKDAKKITRSGIVASSGGVIGEHDFSGIEVGTSTCYNRDPNLIKYVSDPSTDMHRDVSSDLWLMTHEQVTKDVRFYGKNGWTFPQFYGSWYMECAKNLWKEVIEKNNLKTASGISVRDHMRMLCTNQYPCGINNLAEFTEHCKEVERIFWKERFKVYDAWKDEIRKFYRKNGYIESKLGFVYRGYLTNNQTTNYQTQGTAFHFLLWTLIEVLKIAEEEGWVTKIIGQIHDCLVTDGPMEEFAHVCKTLDNLAVKLTQTFTWIPVPLEIEHEVSPINGSWFDCKEYKLDGVAPF